ncbi:MAG TPA: ADP-ribosylglycohydrolase family protein [Sphingomicrobium sp.]|nr:ADP-ribosylglycohydrolase family protein [Sphingomicrobium sp.]
MTTSQDRARGVILGQACGDALGAQVEFRPRGTFKTPKDFANGGPHRLKAGMWTDDTIMAVHLAEYILKRGDRHNTTDLMNRWLAWFRNGEGSPTGRCFDIGGRTAAALVCWERTGETLESDATRPFGDGNGAVMRVSPVAVAWPHDTARRRSMADWQGGLTHGFLGRTCAVAIADALAVLLTGGTRDAAVEMADMHLGNEWADPRYLDEPDVQSGGHCLDTTEAALWCLINSESAEEAILKAVTLGNDADTTAAVTGALAGAFWGASALPDRWVNRVYSRDTLVALADQLSLLWSKEP